MRAKKGRSTGKERKTASAYGSTPKQTGNKVSWKGNLRHGSHGEDAARPWRRKWTKRTVKVRQAKISGAGIEAIVREWRRSLLRSYRQANLSLDDITAEIGLTRQGLARLLVKQKTRPLFDTFVRTCLILAEGEYGFTISVEGWEFQLRWSFARGNSCCVSSPGTRA